MKILFSCGNAPGLPTGYGGQGLLAVKAFLSMGHSVTVLAWNLTPPHFKPFVQYSSEEVLRTQPHMKKAFRTKDAHDVDWTRVRWLCNPYEKFPVPIRKSDLNRMIVDENADLFVALQDIFMYEPGSFLCKSAVWMPLHFIPVEHPTVMALSDFDMQLPISGWGATLLSTLYGKNHGPTGLQTLRDIQVVPHGKNIDIFKPCQESRQTTRRLWGWPQDAFVCLLIASNSEESGRKAFDAQIQAFQLFKSKEPRAYLHIHAENTRAYDIPRLLEIFGAFDTRASWLDWKDSRVRTLPDATIIGDRVSVSPPTKLLNIEDADLVKMYCAADVLLAATCSEGCGVPILEAQLCGTPVITTRTTAMWEETMLGISVKPLQWIARMDFNSGWFLPDAKGISDALVEICGWGEKLQQEREKHLPKIRDAYSNEAVIQKWTSVLQPSPLPSKREKSIQVSDQIRSMLREKTKLSEKNQKNLTLLREQYKDTLIRNYLKTLL